MQFLRGSGRLLETEVAFDQFFARLALDLTAPDKLTVARLVDDFATSPPASSTADVGAVFATLTVLDVDGAVVGRGVHVDELVAHLLRRGVQCLDVSLGAAGGRGRRAADKELLVGGSDEFGELVLVMKTGGEFVEFGHHLPARLRHAASRDSVALAFAVHGCSEKATTDSVVVQVHLGAGLGGVLTVVLIDKLATESVAELDVV